MVKTFCQQRVQMSIKRYGRVMRQKGQYSRIISQEKDSIFLLQISFKMQSGASVIKNELWNNLEVLYNQCKKEKGEIPTGDLDDFIADVLKESDCNERDYILKNLWRLDSDQSGTVSLTQLGNFLFKRHAGEISLQRQHKKGAMAHGSQYKMNVKEFGLLLNLAFQFLNVTVEPATAEEIFKKADLDNDGLITYVEYFKVIEFEACRSSKDEEQRKRLEEEERLKKEYEAKASKGLLEKGKLRSSRLRKFVWDCLRRAFNLYIKDRSLIATQEELKGLCNFILNGLSNNELNLVSVNLVTVLGDKPLAFQTFAPLFLILAAQLGLGRWSINRSYSKRQLEPGDVILLENSFPFADFTALKREAMDKLFGTIDLNKDGTITYQEYMLWVKNYLAVTDLYGDGYYIPEDDQELKDQTMFVDRPKTISYDTYEQKAGTKSSSSSNASQTGIDFSKLDNQFANKVRETTKKLLEVYDADKNGEFNKIEIEAALIGLLKQNPDQLKYVTQNVFRYDRNNDGSVSYDELTNFCTEHHFGEMAIQRLHRKKHYSEGNKRRMNCSEFGITLTDVLGYIGLSAPAELISEWFSVIDVKKEGWISYEVYFMFLRYYFGSSSISAQTQKTASKPSLSDNQKFLESLKDLNPFQRFTRLFVDQLKDIFYRFDYNNNKTFESNEIKDILTQVFAFDSSQLSYIMMKYFNYDKSSNSSITFEELIALILTIYFTEIVFKRKYGKDNSKNWKDVKISAAQFVQLFTQFGAFIKITPSEQDLLYIFKELDTDNDGFITFQQYLNFVRKYLGNGIDLDSSRFKAQAPNDIPAEELAFVNAIWDELKVYFDKYDQGAKGFLVETQLKAFVVEVLQETTQRELDYVFWNLFRVDSNSNKEVDFLEFAPFILRHAGEISLQRFHRQQQAGKSSLNFPEFYRVIGNAYSFLSSIPKQKKVVEGIFSRVKNADGCGYANLLNWIHFALAQKYKPTS